MNKMFIPLTRSTWLHAVRHCAHGSTALTRQVLLWVFFSLSCLAPVLAQTGLAVKGTVSDEKGTPLPGVSVRIKDTTTGTATNSDGTYLIQVPNENAVLIFSYIGYTSQQKVAGTSGNVNINLEEEVAALNEVVVVGYGTVKRSDVTGSVAQVEMKDFEKAPVRALDEALAGRVAGVTVSGNDGQPGQSNNIVIRGANSVTQSNAPLYVVDGFPLEATDLNSISPSDIESIDILKDASATAIYGSRGANGVIIVTTKKGKKGAPVLSFNTYYGLQQITQRQELLSPYEFVRLQLELNPTGASGIYLKDGRTLDSYRSATGSNLQEKLYRIAPIQNYDVSLRGGTDQSRYSISANVFDQQGIILNSGFRRYQGRITIDQTVSKLLKIGLNANYSNSVSHGALINSTFNNDPNASVLGNVWGYRPVTGNDDEEELAELLVDPSLPSGTDSRVNPILSLRNEERRIINNTLYANLYTEFSFTNSLKLRITGGYTNNPARTQNFFNSRTQQARVGLPSSRGINGFNQDNTQHNFLNENTLTFNKTFNSLHSLTVLAGVTAQAATSSNYRIEGNFLPFDELGLDGLDQGANTVIQSGNSESRLASYLGRVNYDFKKKYLLTASLRTDGSSKFRPGYQWGVFPSGSIAWRMINEPFMENLKVISDSKLRLSYGATGNNRVGDFATYSPVALNINFSSVSYNNATPVLSALINSVANPVLKWETTLQSNLGYDLGLFENRIQLTADVYRKTTKDLLLSASLPFSSGYQNSTLNIGSVQNQGLELSLNTTNVKTTDFSWTTNFNISFNQSKLLELVEGQEALGQTVNFTAAAANNYNAVQSYISRIGGPLGQMQGAIFDGIYQYSDFEQLPDGRYLLRSEVTSNGTARASVQPGDMKYKDLNGDLQVDTRDFTIIGRGLPIHTGGFTNNFVYKGFDLNVFTQWSYGNDAINATRIVYGYNGLNNTSRNLFADYANRWTPDNPSNRLPRAQGVRPTFYGSHLVEDASFIRLKTVSLGYNLNPEFLTPVHITGLRVYVSAQNLYTLTRYTGSDPEVSVRPGVLTPGYDFTAYPRARTLTFGLNASF